jgi:hypothetical protein
MRPRGSFRWPVWLALGGALAMIGSAHRAQGQGSSTPKVVRTLVYHEITTLTDGISPNPILSASGNRAVFTVSPGSGDPARPNRIFVVNADGTGLREVDSYTTKCFCGSMVDISADGSKVISSEGVQLRIANADGSSGRTLFDGGEIRYIRTSGDGSKVFFQERRDTAAAQRGVWVINADGSGLRQVVGPDQVGKLLGIPADNVFTFDVNGWALDVSRDGSRIVFGTHAHAPQAPEQPFGDRIFGVNLDGSGLHPILEAMNFVSHAGISADGTKVLYDIIPAPAPSTNEGGVVDFDGTGRKALAAPSRRLPQGFPGSAERLQLSADGSKLLLGTTGVLFDTATGAPLQLAARGGYFSNDPGRLADEGMYVATMNESATRFLYITGPAEAGKPGQLATLDLNPATLGDAPLISSVTIDPPSLLTQGRSAATVTAQVSGGQLILRVGAMALFTGLTDENLGPVVLLDDGQNGDTRGGDSLFTSTGLRTNCCTEVGPRTVRIKAEARAADGRRHATAVDLEPFAVVNQ